MINIDKNQPFHRSSSKLHYNNKTNTTIPGDSKSRVKFDPLTEVYVSRRGKFPRKTIEKHCNIENLLDHSHNQPLIALMVASTTRKIRKVHMNFMSLFNKLFPSLKVSLDCGYQYMVILGFDQGDPYFDSIKGKEQIMKYFEEEMIKPLQLRNISIKLEYMKISNPNKVPGPVFLDMAQHAYNLNATFMYRITDDTEFLDNWANIYVTTLLHQKNPYL